MSLCVPGMPCFSNTPSSCGCEGVVYTTYPSGCNSECNPISSDCVTYTGASLINSAIESGDDLTVAIQKLDQMISSGGVPLSRELTINGVTYDLSEDREWSVGVIESLSEGTGISIGGTSTVPIITNTAPDQTVTLTEGTNISITGTYPNFTISASGGGGGITNSAANTELMMSNGTNAVSSGFFSPSVGVFQLGDASTAGTKVISAINSTSDASLSIVAQASLNLRGFMTIYTNTLAYLSDGAYIQGQGSLLINSIGELTIGALTFNSGVAPNINITAANADVTATQAGSVIITGGQTNVDGVNAGNVFIIGGDSTSTGKEGNIGMFTTSGSFGTGEKVTFFANSTTQAAGTISGGGTLSVVAGLPIWRTGTTDYPLTGGGSGITVGATTITSGTSTRIPFNDGGIYGEDSALTWDKTNNALTISGNRIHSVGTVGNLFIGDTAGNFTNTGTGNIGIGYLSLNVLTSGNFNTIIGYQSGAVGLTTGLRNTGVGAVIFNSGSGPTGTDNIAIGYGTLSSITSGSYNIGIGASNTTTSGDGNIYIGYDGTQTNPTTTGSQNVKIGHNISFNSGGNGRSGYLNIQNAIFGISNTGTGTIVSSGNIGFYTSAFGTNAAKVLGIGIGTAPSTSAADTIQIFAKDSSDGSTNATLALYLEQAVEAIGTFTPSHKIKVWINGIEYWLQLDAV